MWERKQLKRISRRNVKRNYWNCIAVCLMMSFFFGKYPINVETLRIFHNASNMMEIDSVDDVEKLLEEDHIEECKKEKIITVLTTHLGAVIISIITTAGSFICMAVRMLGNMNTEGANLWLLAISIVSVCVFFTLGIVNIILVGEIRFFLENRRYKRTHLFRIFFLYRYGLTRNVFCVMFKYTALVFLWSLTIVGGVVKAYEYQMVPYLLAENPKIGSKEAFALSKQMMHGNKWNSFLLDMSFAGWLLLSILTLGCTAAFWSISYQMAARAELYVVLRNKAIEDKMEYWEQCNDEYLVEA